MKHQPLETMKKLIFAPRFQALLAGIACLALNSADAATVYLRTGIVNKTLPDGRVVQMWAFARDTAFGANNGVLSVPGPVITLGTSDHTLEIRLDNNLPVPVSLMIPGVPAATINPVRTGGRITSFNTETPPGNTAYVAYRWTNMPPGTFLYQSGSHPAVQVQMGLYGAIKKDLSSSPRQAYTGVPYDREVTLLFSEIDPDLHDAVASGNYGPGQAMTSTVHYHPQYFLVNGNPYTTSTLPIFAGTVGQRLLMRFINAGIDYKVPVIKGLYSSLVAEDAKRLTYPREQYSTFLPPAKVMETTMRVGAAGLYPVFDRRLNLFNGTNSPGGMLASLDIRASTPASLRVPEAEEGTFGLLASLRLQQTITRPDGQVDLLIEGDSGHDYVIESSPDLKVWQVIHRGTVESSVFEFTDTNAQKQGSKFYRARYVH